MRGSLLSFVCLALPAALGAQELERVWCADVDPASRCPGDDCLCTDDTLEIVFGNERTSSVFEYEEFQEGMFIQSHVVIDAVSPEIRGYSLGVTHDSSVLAIRPGRIGLNVDDTATLVSLKPGVRRTPGGYILAVVLNFTRPVVLPLGRSALINASYELLDDVGTKGTAVRFSSELGLPSTDLVLTVDLLDFPETVDRPEGDCVNGRDDDEDGRVDRDDPDCVVRNGVARRPRRVIDGWIRRRGPAPPTFRRGDANGDGRLDLSDAVVIIRVVFAGSPRPVDCFDALDTDDDGQVGATDGLPLLAYLFRVGPLVPHPSLLCGREFDGDLLSCIESNCAP